MSGKRSLMDALDAPQWTDFTSSPQVSDDFFNRLHLEHELEYHQKLQKYSEIQFSSMTSESDFEDVLDKVQITPVKVLSPRSKNNKEEKLETTVGDLLYEAMSNLELSSKKGRLNKSTANSSDNFKTPKMPPKRITRSMSAKKNCDDSLSRVASKLNMNDTGPKTPEKTDNQNLKNDSKETEDSKEKKAPSRIATSFSGDKFPYSTDTENKENDQGNNTCLFKSSETHAIEKVTLKTQNHNEVDSGIEVLKEKKVRSRIVTSFSNPAGNRSTSREKTDQKKQATSITAKSLETKTCPKQSLKSQKVGETGADASTQKQKKPLSSRIVTSFGSTKSIGSTKSDITAIKPRPHLLSSQLRRHSLSKQKRNEPYISLAEAVSKFQKGTPKRFRSVSTKGLKPGPVAALKQVTLKITRPISPALTSKTRVRPVKALSHEEREKLEIEKGRSRIIKANPVPKSSLKKVEPTKKVEKKPFTVPEPFQFNYRKIRQFSSSESLASKQPRNCNTNSNLYEALNLREPVQKKVVHAIVSSEDENLAVKEEELGHFGIPTEPCGKPKKFTRTLPFSFETRNKEFQDKKERKLKQIQSEELKMKKMKDFHAKPAPTSLVSREPGPIKGRMTPKAKESTTAKKTTLCPFSFEERNKLLLKKKENLIKETLEKDKKAREFHANPVPEFRPVFVRGRSRENIKIEEKTPEKQKIIKSLQAKTHPTHLPKKEIGNQENTQSKSVKFLRAHKSETNLDDAQLNLKGKGSSLSELNTDKRARERKDFQDKLRRKEMAEEELRRREEEERLTREKAETAELRRMAEVKARPMPQYKPVSIIKSSKPLTDPHSPDW
ncbi:targeting protein for Xklp2-A-like isoform X2 [Belonocnema kinseyi]|nr:targeting protein for Xklp2-A-like isoform X2 [Belonocnema kinseyi]